jgi:hypothetical protein
MLKCIVIYMVQSRRINFINCTNRFIPPLFFSINSIHKLTLQFDVIVPQIFYIPIGYIKCINKLTACESVDEDNISHSYLLYALILFTKLNSTTNPRIAAKIRYFGKRMWKPHFGDSL